MKINFTDHLGTFSFEGDHDELRAVWSDVFRIRQEEKLWRESRTLPRRIRAMADEMRYWIRLARAAKEARGELDNA